jgi:hypothetical protein
MPERSTAPRWPRVSIGALLGLVALAAIGCAWPGIVPTEILAVLLWLQTRKGSEAATARLISLGVVVAAVYLPLVANFVWFPWSMNLKGGAVDWRQEWSRVFLSVPGILPAMILGPVLELIRPLLGPVLASVAFLALTSVLAAGLMYILTLLAGQSWRRRMLVATLALGGSTLFMWIYCIVSYVG